MKQPSQPGAGLAAAMSPAATTAERVITVVEERRPAFLEAIDSARRRVALSMFRCTDFKIMDRLGDALTRGVQVELLLTQRAKGWEKKIRELGQYLESMGARVHRYDLPNVKYHAKYLLVDDHTALVASLNLTRKSFEKTADFLLVSRDRDLVSSLAGLFARDVESPGSALPESFSRRLIVGPEASRSRMRAILAAAEKSIRIVDHRVTDPEMVALLKSREAEGLRVEVFGRKSVEGLKSHGKMMIVDGRTAVLGSISLSPPSLGSRRELAVIIEDAASVSALNRFLDNRTGAKAASLAAVSPFAVENAPADDDDEEDEGEDA